MKIEQVRELVRLHQDIEQRLEEARGRVKTLQDQLAQERGFLATLERNEAEHRTRIERAFGEPAQLSLVEVAPEPESEARPAQKRRRPYKHNAEGQYILALAALQGECVKAELHARCGRSTSKPGGALTGMRKRGLVSYSGKRNPREVVTLTAAGWRLAREVYAPRAAAAVENARNRHDALIAAGLAGERRTAGLILANVVGRPAVGLAVAQAGATA